MSNLFKPDYNPYLMEKKLNRVTIAVIAIWLLGVLVSLSVGVGIVWIICHFAAKYW